MSLSRITSLLKKKRFWIFVIPFLLVVFVKSFLWTPYRILDSWMDSPLTKDESLHDPNYLVSTRFSEFSPALLNTPVIVAVHGYSATTFETDELRAYMEKKGVLVSQVLMGGHGRDLDSFIASSWHDWGGPILHEVEQLKALGFKHISILAISASGAITVDYLDNGLLDGKVEHIFLVDPFIESRNKALYYSSFLGLFMHNFPAWVGRNHIKVANWYNNNPAPTLTQLSQLVKQVRHDIKDGITIPNGMSVTVFQSDNDPVADPEGSYALVSSMSGNKNLLKIPSPHHVSIQGGARDKDEWSHTDIENQHRIFEQIFTTVARH